MKSNWNECKLSEIGTIVGGATPSTKNNDNYDGGTIAWITPKDLAGYSGRYISAGERNITDEGLKSCSTVLMPKNAVLFSSRAPIGYVAIAANELCTNQGFKSVVPNEKIDYMFLYYLLKYNREAIEKLGTGTTFKEVSGSTMKNVKVCIPDSLEEQKAIAAILSALDDKIELNNRINKNLEQQAYALFKKYFDINNITNSEYLVTLDEFCNIFTGKKNANASIESGKYKFFTCSPDPLLIDSFIYDGQAIIVSGNGAYTGRTRFYEGRFDLYQRTYACTIKDDVNPDYIFLLYWLVKFELSVKIMGGTHGTAIPYIVMNDLAKFKFPYDEGLFSELSSMFKSYVTMIQKNENQNETLSNLRDSLLPKLMSGELDVSNIQL